GGSHRAEIAAVDARHPLRMRSISDVNPRADHVVELAAERLDGGADLVEDIDGLSFGVARTYHGALAVRGGRATDENATTGPHRARSAPRGWPATCWPPVPTPAPAPWTAPRGAARLARVTAFANLWRDDLAVSRSAPPKPRSCIFSTGNFEPVVVGAVARPKDR